MDRLLDATWTTMQSLAGRVLVRPPASVPIVVDAHRVVESAEMARCAYFVVAADVPWPDWAIGPEGDLPALHMLGATGVLYGRGSRAQTFSASDQLEQVFALVDDLDGLSIEFEDVWIPLDWFDGECELRSVYRIGLAHFQAAYRYREGAISVETFLATDAAGEVTYSPAETQAYQTWGLRQIEEAIWLYAEKDPELKLANRELPQEWSQGV